MYSGREFEEEHYAWDFKTQSTADEPWENHSERSTSTCRRHSGIKQELVWSSGLRRELSSGISLYWKKDRSETDPDIVETNDAHFSSGNARVASSPFRREFPIHSDARAKALRPTGRHYKVNPFFLHAPRELLHIKPKPRSFLPVSPSLQFPIVEEAVGINKLISATGTSPLRHPFFNANGPLPDQHPRWRDMEEQATQQATQPYMDLRRDGHLIMENEADEGDVICILHSASVTACRAVELIAEATPQHILITRGIKQSKDQNPQAVVQEHDSKDQDLTSLHSEGSGKKAAGEKVVVSKDIALRLSSRLREPCMGFVFGRGTKKCDLTLSEEGEYGSRISSSHFRIFFNRLGVLMLEDMSTNGTYFNKERLAGIDKKRMITGGEIIEIIGLNGEADLCMRFIVTIPLRHSDENAFAHNLPKYIAWRDQEVRRADVHKQAEVDGKIIPPVQIPFNPFDDSVKDLVPSDNESHLNLNLANKRFNHGMEWSGGDRFNVVGQIGRGAFASVFKLATKRDGEYYAAKQIEKRHFMKSNTVDSKIHNEMDIMKRLCHPNIVQFVEHQDELRHLYIIMEFVPGGDLTSFIKRGTVMAEYMCQSVAEQICDAVDYLHGCNVTHRDIKPDNILIQTRDPLVVKLTDFGLSKWVANEETYLKSFCGTLLYCAPEIYPDYGLYKAGVQGKRARNKNAPPKTSPYNQSVDTWALGAVLYHLLSGTPPFRGGSSDDRGSSMLEIVMTSPLDRGRLKNAGVSYEGIDFVSKMLVVDPAGRSTEAQLLKHPWITKIGQVIDADDVQMAGGTRALDSIDECGSELDVSQLSLAENALDQEINDSEDELNTDVDEIEGGRESKRFKTSDRPHGPEDDHISYPHLPGEPTESVYSEPAPPPTTTTGRLFGEIGASALRSSGVLGFDAHAALEMPLEGSRDESFDTSESWIDDARIISDEGALSAAGYPQAQPGLVSMGGAPSLFGTEALVGQLNMTSLGSDGSATSSRSAFQTRRHTPKSRDASVVPAGPVPGSKGSSQQAPKSFVDHTKPGTKNLSGFETRSNRNHSKGTSTDDGLLQKFGAERGKSANRRSPSILAATTNQETTISTNRAETKFGVDSMRETNTHAQEERTSQSHHAVHHRDRRNTSVSDASQVSERAADDDDDDITSPLSFPKPPPRFGTLTALPGSLCNTIIRLEQRITYYGRDPSSHVRHPNLKETRIPKNALDIIFWRPGIEAMIENGKEWSTLDGLYAIAHTRTSKNIKVNGVKLTKGGGCWNYGRLHTGDVITIFGPPEGEQGEGKSAEYLKFRCEFSIGLSAQPRAADQPRFVVEKEEEKYMQKQTRRSMSAASRDSKSTV